MPTVAQQLQQLQTDKQTLVTKLNEKGVEVSNDETFTTLCPKVGEIQSGADIGEYFNVTPNAYGASSNTSVGNWYRMIKKIPKFTGSPTSLRNFFYYSNAYEIDLSGLDTSKVTNMNSMFNYCRNIASLDVSNFDTSNVTDMGSMFTGCMGLTSIDLSNFDTSKVTSTYGMFLQCNALVKVIINNQNIFTVTGSVMFGGTPIERKTGYIYVPDDLVESYKSATNWSVYASQIKGMSELPQEE